MQRFPILFVYVILQGTLLFSQDSLYILHPVVGAIIDRKEKTEYVLFREVADTTFNYGYIRYADNKYYLNLFLIADSFTKREIDTSEIREYLTNIEKLAIYYRILQEEDSTRNTEKKIIMVESETGQPYQIKNKILDSYILEKISDDTRREGRLQDDAETQKLWKQGSNMDNAGNYIDIDYRRKRRK
jgi:hypothetical protein